MALKATITVVYEPDPRDYRDPAGDPDHLPEDDEMAEIDQENWQRDPIMFFSSFEDDEYRVKVEPHYE